MYIPCKQHEQYFCNEKHLIDRKKERNETHYLPCIISIINSCTKLYEAFIQGV